MTTQESKPPDTRADSPGPARTGPNWGRVISLFAWLGFLGLFTRRHDADGRRPARGQPERRGAAPSGRVPDRIRSLAGHPAGRRLDHGRGADHRLHPWLAEKPRQPGADDGPGDDADRVAGPDHELVAVRGVQPGVVALAGVLAPDHDVADRRTVHRVRIRDVLLRPVLPGDLDSSQDAGASAVRNRSSAGTR